MIDWDSDTADSVIHESISFGSKLPHHPGDSMEEPELLMVSNHLYIEHF
jgi:hypothetical protein